jgi:hypothetical protein
MFKHNKKINNDNNLNIEGVINSHQFNKRISTYTSNTTRKRHSFLDFFRFHGAMFITKNTFISLKTDVHNLCTTAKLRNITTYVHRPDRPG